MPLRFPVVGGHEHAGVRGRLHGNYLIFYIVLIEEVRVLRIVNGAQDYERILFPAD